VSATAYDRLTSTFGRIGALRDAEAMLHWDLATMMPAGSAEARAEARADQLAALKAVRHGFITAPEIADLLDAAERDGLDGWQAANVREMRHAWVHAAALHEDLVEALSRATSACETAWRQARADDDFAHALPKLEAALALVREAAAAKADVLGVTPYDALLDEWEPGGRAADIEPVFAELAAFLPGFLEQVLAAQARAPALIRLDGPFSIDAQRALGVRLMERLGFVFSHGRLDISLHPFCGGTPDDVRITTRYDEDDFTKALMGVLHETGHALYERGLPAAWRGQPVGDARGMSIHESQSLLIEMQVCRSRDFLAFAAPLMAEAFGGTGAAWEADNLFRLYSRVERSLIRVDADEVTYPAHVILRFDLERAMVAGDLAPADLPSAWADGMERLLGIVPPDNRTGCLQDIHWYDGAWGYFPTYTLGAMAAAQLFDAARRADPAIVPGIRVGDFAPLLGWLRENVHAKASLLSTPVQLERSGGLATITLNRPQAFNALDLALGEALVDAAIACDEDASVRAVMITGEGRAFCGGGDIRQMRERADAEGRAAAFLKKLTLTLHAAVATFARMPKPVVTAVNGPAAGAGFSHTVCGDLVVAADTATFALAYTAIGLAPDSGSTFYLPRLVGAKRAFALIAENRPLSAAEAQTLGLVNEVFPADSFAADAEALARRLAEGPTQALGAAKKLLMLSVRPESS